MPREGWSPFGEGEFIAQSGNGEEPSSLHFLWARLHDPPLGQPIRSGEPSGILEGFERELRDARRAHPDLPLVAWATPQDYWQRSHAWMVGEYLAERDLPLLASFHLHPQRAVDWVAHLSECGLLNERSVLEFPSHSRREDFHFLEGLGCWALWPEATASRFHLDSF